MHFYEVYLWHQWASLDRDYRVGSVSASAYPEFWTTPDPFPQQGSQGEGEVRVPSSQLKITTVVNGNHMVSWHLWGINEYIKSGRSVFGILRITWEPQADMKITKLLYCWTISEPISRKPCWCLVITFLSVCLSIYLSICLSSTLIYLYSCHLLACPC